VTHANATADTLSRYHGRPGARQDHAEVRLDTFYLRILQGNSAPRQRAAGHIPLKHTGDLNKSPPAAGDFLASPAGARWKRSMAMCAEDDVSPGARYCEGSAEAMVRTAPCAVRTIIT